MVLEDILIRKGIPGPRRKIGEIFLLRTKSDDGTAADIIFSGLPQGSPLSIMYIFFNAKLVEETASNWGGLGFVGDYTRVLRTKMKPTYLTDCAQRVLDKENRF